MTTKILIIAIIVLASTLSVTAIFGYNRSNKYKSLIREPPVPVSLDPLAIRSTQLDTIEQRIDNFDPTNYDTYTMVSKKCAEELYGNCILNIQKYNTSIYTF